MSKFQNPNYDSLQAQQDYSGCKNCPKNGKCSYQASNELCDDSDYDTEESMGIDPYDF